MRKLIRSSIYLFTIILTALTVRAQGDMKPSRALLDGLPGVPYVDVTLGKEFATITSPPTGALYSIDKDKNEVEVARIPAGIASPYRNFRISFAGAMQPYNPDLSYEVLVFVPSVSASGAPITLKKAIKVTRLFEVEMLIRPGCAGIRMVISTRMPGPDVWLPVYSWLDQFGGVNARNIATVRVRPLEDPNEVEYFVENVVWKRSPIQGLASQLRVCLEFSEPLPARDFNATFTFHGPNLPPSISTAQGEQLSGAFAVPFPKNEEVAEPAKRGFERNLDLGLTGTSEVKDEVIPKTDTTPEMTERKRTSRVVVDLRFKPWMDVLHPVFRSNRWLHYLTPVFINANVATGKIEEETLGLNRVLIGLEGESRYVHKREFDERLSNNEVRHRETYPFWHRLVWGFTHASDRDFKQKEFTGKLEYRPVIDKLYRPYTLNYRYDKEGFKHQNWYGFTFLPMVGFEFGRTYSRRNPVPDIKPSDTVKRFTFGGELTLDLTEYVTLSLIDNFYVRGENPQDHFKNYFKGSGEFRLGRSRNRLFAHSLFITFERGQQPPFASPDVNSFRIGYRLQGNYCGEHCR